MTDSEQEPNLADVLLDHELISLAQLELAIADQAINDIPLEEILMVRGWITEQKLYEVAPWLKPGGARPSSKPEPAKVEKAADNNEAARKALLKASQSYPKQERATDKDEAAAQKPANKPADIPKEPPFRPAGEPVVITSPVATDSDANLKSYKEVLKKILSLES